MTQPRIGYRWRFVCPVCCETIQIDRRPVHRYVRVNCDADHEPVEMQIVSQQQVRY
jgi:hypothetical protein